VPPRRASQRGAPAGREAIATLKLKLQLYCGDEIAMGPGKADLLEAIARTGSISAAGRAIGMSYRRAWLLVDTMNRCFREPLVEAHPGGGKAAGAKVTAAGNAALAAYRSLSGQVEESAAGPDYAALDLKMDGDSGLVLLPKLLELDPEMRVVILTGYSSIATAVEAIKRGACNYLCKPADADDVLAALLSEHADLDSLVPENPMSVDRLQWEHIQRVLTEHEGNISATARALGMHRRTLQRKLQKRPVRR